MGINWLFFFNGFQEQTAFGDHMCVTPKLQKLRLSEGQEFKASLALEIIPSQFELLCIF